MENKKARAEIQYHPNKEKLQKRSREFYINLSEDEKIKKKIVILTLEIKKCQTQIEGRKRIYEKLLL